MQLFTPAGIAFSNGASSRTTNADLPPSSRHTFLMPSPASDATRRPACSDPVKLTMSTSGWPTIASPTTRPSPDTMLSTPAGRPISCAASASMKALSGASSAGFSTTVHPAASAGRDLADHLVQRVVPRRDAADDADRLLDDERVAQLLFQLGAAHELGVQRRSSRPGTPPAPWWRSRARCRLRARSPRRPAARAPSSPRRASRATARAPRAARGSTTRSRGARPSPPRSTSSADAARHAADRRFGGGGDDVDGCPRWWKAASRRRSSAGRSDFMRMQLIVF